MVRVGILIDRPWSRRALLAALWTLCLWLSTPGTASADDSTVVRFPRFPALSPDGTTVVFTYEGDLWRVSSDGGRAERLTVHPAYDRRPRYSDDGKQIAFASNRHGSDDAFVMPATGGEPKRLTFWSGHDSPAAWLPDNRLLIHSSRGVYWNRSTRLYRIRTDKIVEPQLVTRAAGVGATLSPDGTRMLFVREGEAWSRKRYRGPRASQIWLFDFDKGTFEEVRRGPERHAWPLWDPDGKHFYYVREIAGTDQLFRGQLGSKVETQLTDFVNDGVRFPAVARNRSFLVFEQGFDLWSYDFQDRSLKQLEIRVATDRSTPSTVSHTVTSATDMAPSPDGKQIAFSARGEIWVRRAKEGLQPNRVTRHPARDHSPTWTTDGKTLLFSSERDGKSDLYVARSAQPDEPRLDRCLTIEVERFPGPPGERSFATYSPDGKSIAYIAGSGTLCVAEAAGGPARVLVESWDTPYYRWSPDSAWLAYSVDDNDFNRDVWVVRADGSEAPRNITVHPGADYGVAWSPDGKKLAFISDRLGDNRELWWVWLDRTDDDRTAEDRELLDDPPPPADGDKKKNKKKEKKSGEVEVVIDFENIHRRFRRAFSSTGTESPPVWSPDSKSVAFVSNFEGSSALYKIDLPGGKSPKKIASGSGSPIAWLSETKRIYRVSGGTPESYTASGKRERYGFRVTHRVDRQEDQAHVFDQAWRIMDRVYYDAEHGGSNWAAQKEKYRPVAISRHSRREFGDLINMMLGELNGSHLGFGVAGTYTAPDRPQTGVLGLEFESVDEPPGLKVRHVLAGGPCDRGDSKLAPGDRLLAINGVPLDETTNRSQLLADTVGRRVRLEVRRAGSDSATEVILRPTTSRARTGLLYEQWLAQCRERVAARSAGRLGYVHIRSMNVPNLERFETELYSIGHGKDGLLIDVRDNGGGWITDFLLAMLTRKPHAITVPRGGGPGYPIGRLVAPSWTKPIAVLCNQNSFSNAEIFSHSIKTLKRGKLIGVQTAGGVISTGRQTLLDGSTLRTPFRGWYLVESGLDMELNGALPDYPVRKTPQDEVSGSDPQLEKAIDVLLDELPRGQRRAF